MKKIVRYCIFCLIFPLMGGDTDLFAQVKWIPKSTSLQVPLMVHYHGYSTVFAHSYDAQNNAKKILDFSLPDNFKNYSRHGDTVIILYDSHLYNPNSLTFIPFIPGVTTVHFILDSIEEKLKDLFIGSVYDSSYSNPYEHWAQSNSFIIFSSLGYKRVTDSSIIFNKSGYLERKDFDTSYYYYYSGNIPTGKFPQEIFAEKDESYSLTIDTVSSVSIRNNAVIVQTLSITISISDYTTHFFFPSSDHSQTLLIYDILGREVKRIEIPSGVSEYRLERDGFMSGYYFARLGNLNAKFVVN